MRWFNGITLECKNTPRSKLLGNLSKENKLLLQKSKPLSPKCQPAREASPPRGLKQQLPTHPLLIVSLINQR